MKHLCNVLHEISEIIKFILWDGLRTQIAAKVLANSIKRGGGDRSGRGRVRG